MPRLRDQLPLAAMNPNTLYSGGAEGCTDYPVTDRAARAA